MPEILNVQAKVIPFWVRVIHFKQNFYGTYEMLLEYSLSRLALGELCNRRNTYKAGL